MHDEDWDPFATPEERTPEEVDGGREGSKGAWGAMTNMVSDFLDNDDLKALTETPTPTPWCTLARSRTSPDPQAKEADAALEEEVMADETDPKVRAILDRAREIFKGPRCSPLESCRARVGALLTYHDRILILIMISILIWSPPRRP